VVTGLQEIGKPASKIGRDWVSTKVTFSFITIDANSSQRHSRLFNVLIKPIYGLQKRLLLGILLIFDRRVAFDGKTMGNTGIEIDLIAAL